jgi:hypothetical protein
MLLAHYRSEQQDNEADNNDLHPGQRQVAAEALRYNVLDCGRRFGKTLFGLNRAKQTLRQGLPAGWFAPTYKLMLDVWMDARRTLAEEILHANKTEMRIELTNGAIFDMWTLDNIDAGRGRKYARVIIDEAALVKNLIDAWQSSIRPTLTDLKGDAWFLSTPKGRNGFWKLYQLGLDATEPEWRCWQMPTLVNPYIDAQEVEAARRMVPERVFAQEYLADFIEDSGYVFRRVMEAATAEALEQGEPGRTYIYGIDWARHHDFTVFSVIDAESKRMVAMDRFNQIEYSLQVGRLKALCKRFPPAAMIAEENSMGGPLVERIQKEERLPVRPFTTTNATKAQIIESLSLAFEQAELEILNDPILTGELMAYDQERLPSGLMRYGAPAGMHDDCVMSLALAWYGANQSGAAAMRQAPVRGREASPLVRRAVRRG